MNHHPRAYNANSACAACKHQRKKCDERCLLSPYFPAEKFREFQAVHRVFGVSNVTKMILAVREADRVRLVESLVCEAFVRQKDPILGIYGEYQKILDELLYFKTLAQNQAVQLRQLEEEVKRISSNTNKVGVGNGNVPVTTSFGLVGWNNRRNNLAANLGRVGMVAATRSESSLKISNAREIESCIIDAIPFTYEMQQHIQIKNENQEREVESTVALLQQSPPMGGFKQGYYMSGML